MCWLCGKLIAHAEVGNHGCNPNELLEWAITRYQFPELRTEQGNTVIVTTQKGADVSILYSPDWTVMDLKRAIEAKTGISVSQMATLNYAGRSLPDGLRLAQCQIRNKCSISLTTSANGG
jgi:hypothetical protein